MDAFDGFGAVLGVTVLLLGVGFAWWRHRVHLNDMQRRLAWSEQSRFELERQTQDLGMRLASIAQNLKSLHGTGGLDTGPGFGGDGLAMPGKTAKTAKPARPSRPFLPSEPLAAWKDTEALPDDDDGPYSQTLPLELGVHDAAAPSRQRKRGRVSS